MTLEEHLKSIDPEMNSDKVNALVTAIQEKIDAARDEGRAEGLAKIEEAVAETEEECAAKLQTYADTVDEHHTQKLEQLAESLDEYHTERLTTLMETVDEVYTNRIESLCEALDEEYSDKLQQLIEATDEHHTVKLQNIANVFEEQAAEQVKAFMDAYLEEAMPTAVAADAAKLARLEEAVNTIREVVVVNDDYIQDEVKEALIDADEQLQEKQAKINDLMAENLDLRKQFKKDEAARLLESITGDMKPAMAAYVEKYFEGVEDVKVISEKKDEAITAFEANEAGEVEDVIEENGGSEIEVPGDDDVTPIEESVDVPDFMDNYVTSINRSSSLMNRITE